VVKDSKKTGHGSEQFLFRLPKGMRKRLAEVAEREGRTMGAVIVTALAIYFENENMLPWSKGYRLSADLEKAIKDLVGQLDIEKAIKDLSDKLAAQDQKLNELLKKE
jgi:hypothetical protein